MNSANNAGQTRQINTSTTSQTTENNNNSPSEPELIQPTVANEHSNGTAEADDGPLSTPTRRTISTEAAIDGAAANRTTNNSAGGEDATFHNFRVRFQELLWELGRELFRHRRRHRSQTLRNILQQGTGIIGIGQHNMGEFLHLYSTGVLLSWILVIIFAFAFEITAGIVCGVVFCHFYDDHTNISPSNTNDSAAINNIDIATQTGEGQQVHRHRSNTTTSNSAGGEDAAFHNVLNRFEELFIEFIQMPQVQESFIRWHQNIRNIARKIDELLSQCPKAILVSLLLVIIFVLIQFYATEISIVLCLWHYVDMTIFNSSGSGWMLISRIVFRQFMLLQLLGQSVFIFAASIFQPISVNPLLIPNPSFRSTLYIVFITEYFIMDCVLCAKILVFNLPKCSTICKRRLYQWLEYSAAIYRFAIPFGQWNAYLNAIWWNVLYNGMWVVYGGMKILLILSLAWHWLLTTLRLFRPIHLGTTPSEAECIMIEQCTICFGEFTSPTKLKCGHIFCSQCIRTWVVDHGHITCPYCRTVVIKEDTNYRNGDSMFPALV